MEKRDVLSVFKKIMLQELFQNLHTLGAELQMSDRAISLESSKVDSWFNDAKNRREDIRISSFINIMSVFSEKRMFNMKSKDLVPGAYLGEELFTNQLIWLSSLCRQIIDAEEFQNIKEVYVFISGTENANMNGLAANLTILKSSKRNFTTPELKVIDDLLKEIHSNN